MRAYIARRLLLFIPTAFGVSNTTSLGAGVFPRRSDESMDLPDVDRTVTAWDLSRW